jgi:hypothetical protein
MDPCAICLEEINPEDKLAINLNVVRICIHKFHHTCMKEWRKQCPGRGTTCPVCKRYWINKAC